MQTLNSRELRNTIPHLTEALAREHELVVTQRGTAVARILPMAEPPKFESMAWLRAMSPPSAVPSEVLIREDRDRRGS
jgi:antitoxin (DNA-binding transcriptional repressor) of toxin-antitoxin stability system